MIFMIKRNLSPLLVKCGGRGGSGFVGMINPGEKGLLLKEYKIRFLNVILFKLL